jgi:nucleoside-diphosphate-sugar epimerase
VHRLDAARLYLLALEESTGKDAGVVRYNAVAEEGVPVRDIAEAIGRCLKVPVVLKFLEEVGEHFGWLGHFAGADAPASSALTQERLGWRPTRVGLLTDLECARDFEA